MEKITINLNTPSKSNKNIRSENLKSDDQWLQLNQTMRLTPKQNHYRLSKFTKRFILRTYKDWKKRNLTFRIIWRINLCINFLQKHILLKMMNKKRSKITKNCQSRLSLKRLKGIRVLTKQYTQGRFSQQ